MGKVEALFRVILSPMESMVDTYRDLLPEETTVDFQRILDLKGLKKVEHQNLLDDFSRHNSGINIPQTTSPKWFSTNKGFLGAGPSGIMIVDAIITKAGTMLVAGVPIVNPSTIVVWEVTPGIGSNP